MVNNPVAATADFEHMLNNVFEVLLKTPVSGSYGGSRKTNHSRFLPQGGKGILGRTTAFTAVIEAQHRGSLHVHAIIWGV